MCDDTKSLLVVVKYQWILKLLLIFNLRPGTDTFYRGQGTLKVIKDKPQN